MIYINESLKDYEEIELAETVGETERDGIGGDRESGSKL